MPFPSPLPSARLRNLISELEFANQVLRTESRVDGPLLRELRQAIDNVRLTAWTVSELQNARDTQQDTRAMLSFLTAERLRRFRRMIEDFSADLEHDGKSWQATSLSDLQDSVSILRERLALLAVRRRENPVATDRY